MFDKRGTGMSDRAVGVPTLEERMEDVTAVMAAAGSDRAVLFGGSEGGAISALCAATYPEKVISLVLYGCGATGWQPDAERQRIIDEYVEQSWGSGNTVDMMAPSVADDDRVRAWFGKWERASASPGAAAALLRMNARFDVRAALPTISVPTLVLHSTGDRTYDVSQGRYFAEHIDGARFIELPGDDHAPWFQNADIVLDLVEEFVTGSKRGADADRVLATILFTDIVDSTAAATRLGDRRWREVLDQYDALFDVELGRHRGNLVKTTGDGSLASFDGPGRAIHCAQAVREAARALDLDLRIGIHTGEIQRRGEDITGLGVVIANRISALAGASEILVSSTVRDLVVGSGIEFEPRGECELKGVPGTWQLLSVAN
jgi:class 3 adenylate cyclase